MPIDNIPEFNPQQVIQNYTYQNQVNDDTNIFAASNSIAKQEINLKDYYNDARHALKYNDFEDAEDKFT